MTEDRKGQKLFNIVAVIVLLFVLGTVSATLFFYRTFLPPYIDSSMPLAEAAHILIFDRTTGGRVLSRVRFFGDDGLKSVSEASDQFEHLDNRNSLWVAELLASSDTSLALEISQDLYSRKKLRPKLVGAVALAAHGQPVDVDFLNSVLAHPRQYEDDADLAKMALKHIHGDTSTGSKP